MTQRGIKENADYDDMAGPFMVIVMFGTLLLMVIPIDDVYPHPFRKARCILGTSTDLV